MQVVREKSAVRTLVARARLNGKTVGFVPTMGALHEGHLSLVRAAADRCDVVLVSVFVNPTQFGPHEDFDRYPRTLDADVALLEATDVADRVVAVFAPSVDEMYGPALSDSEGASPVRTAVIPGSVSKLWEGGLRPGHFDGVALVVTKLLSVVRPDVAFFGEKDYQQLAVVRQLVQDLDLGVQVVGCPIFREADGLAMSSRNRYLTPSARVLAAEIHRSIEVARSAYESGLRDAEKLVATVTAYLESVRGAGGESFEIGYVALVDGATLEPVECAAPDSRLLVSVSLSGTHLIDNSSLI